ncbi:MAG: hypothetical protein AVDCRST_MAG33-1641 [uncultured Thermomicrobiales bacterium]|uniref:DUF2382 domain-containing protein n=1 Tax=uncultured Thermomicrobiales bacterium TaxID=1645740 RepID=A0A6J4UUY9_9BACT|nr:MAG: hypothetical protein AVDCRST_MAG33-1641 [uncultured Thermomicrobiales bacterium]
MDQEWIVQPGTDVYGSDGQKIGKVDDIQDGYLVLHKGFFFPKDHYIPFSAIAGHTDDRIDLNVSSEQATNQDWDRVPTTTTTASAGYVDTAPVADTTVAYDNVQTRTDTDNIRVPVVEEELTATTRGVERGAVRVETHVTEREETLSVPVTEERVHVERVAVNREATAADLSEDHATIDVPVYGEEVDMQKRARVVEEVEISKDAVQETRQVGGTVRREDVEVVDTTVTGVDTTTDGSTRRPR